MALAFTPPGTKSGVKVKVASVSRNKDGYLFITVPILPSKSSSRLNICVVFLSHSGFVNEES